MTLSEGDRWRIVSAVLAAACVILGLLLHSAVQRASLAETRTAHVIFDCYTSPEDREHQGLGR